MSKASSIESKYSCTPPTKPNAYLLLAAGDGMVASIHSANKNLTDIDYALYATGLATDPGTDPAVIETFNINKGYRFDGEKIDTKQIEIFEFRFLRPNKWKTIKGAFATGDTYVDPQIPFLVDGTDNGYFNGTVFSHWYGTAGASYIVNGEATDTWSAADTNGYLYRAMAEWDYSIRYLELQGYNVIPAGFLMGTIAFATGSTDSAVYQAEAEAIIAAVRTRFGANLPTVWMTPDSMNGSTREAAYRTGLNAAAAADQYLAIFDGSVHCKSAFVPYIRTKSMVNLGKFVESWIIKHLGGLTLPSVSNISITGTLKVGSVINPSYTFSGGTEGASSYILLWADDASGTNETFKGDFLKGDTITIPVGGSGKYIKFIITPHSTTNPKTGFSVRNTNWEGPVQA